MKNKNCVRCGNAYDPDGMNQKYCSMCGAIVREEQRKARYERAKKEKRMNGGRKQ